MLSTIAALATLSAWASPDSGVSVQVDSRAKVVILRAGPIDLPASQGHEGYHEYHHHGPVTPLTPFAWPVEGWARGFRLRLVDSAGNEVPKTRLHHVLVLHLEQRELMYPVYERLVALGQESEDVMMPRSVGMRIAKGASLALLAAWVPVAPAPERIFLELTIPYSPANLNPRPVDVVPIGFDVNFEPGGGASFDLPPGASTRERVFEMPLDGRLLVAGGHLHDYAVSMVLTDVASGKAVVELRPELDQVGRIKGVERKLYGVSGDGRRLEAGRRYRLVVTYDNPTGQTLKEGAMGIMVGLFHPDDGRRWPALDQSVAGFKLDLAMFARSGFLPAAGQPER